MRAKLKRAPKLKNITPAYFKKATRKICKSKKNKKITKNLCA
jgi:hypothetical protein